MSGPVVFEVGDKITATCATCRTAVTAANSPLGRAVIAEWEGRHAHGA